MSSFQPTRILGAGVVVGAPPLSHGFSNVYRGIDLGDLGAALAPPSGPSNGASGRGPYRAGARKELAPERAPVPVIVRELGAMRDEADFQKVFALVTRARQRMGSPAPRLLHILGHAGKVIASVEEHLRGTPLGDVMHPVGSEPPPMPVPVALAIGSGLVALWSQAASIGVRTLVEPNDVIVDPAGNVRAIPSFTEERARPEVGAALFSISSLIAYSYPERFLGTAHDARGSMYVLGLLLYEMIAGAHPFDLRDRGAFSAMAQMAEGEAPPLRSRRPDVHPSVAALVHRCLAREPSGRFPSWRELSRAYVAIQALFPATGAAEVCAYVKRLVPGHPLVDPQLDPPSAAQLAALPRTDYLPVPAPRLPIENDLAPAGRAPLDAVTDPDAVYAGVDGRPMLPVNETLRIDARPVTRAEIERFFIVTATPRPPHLLPLGAATDDDACVFVTFEVAESYARWAGKRIPTEMEWQTAVKALGAERLGVGEVWEWTSTPHADGGRVVRGGRWRDVPGLPPDPANRSFATSPAADLGFRCVA